MLSNNHPLTLRAALQVEIGRQEIVAAKGQFDPIIGGMMYHKEFTGTNYYTKYHAGIRQPLSLLGIDLEGGFELNRGTFLNPEDKTPVSGLGYLGLRIPLLQGMMIDRRRTDLQLSKIYQEQTQIRSYDVLNKVLFDGLNTYWNWIRARQKVEVLEEIIQNNQIVFDGIKIAYLQGDRPAIDTVEAYQQLQRITLQYNNELVQLQRALNLLKSNLYNTDAQPVSVNENATTSSFSEASIYNSGLMQKFTEDSLLLLHPEMTLLRNESERLAALLRWEKERLKPRLDLEYNLLTDTGMSPLEQTLVNDNYQAAITLQFPLLFRNARAKTEQLKYASQQNKLDLIDTYNVLSNSLEATRFRLNNTREQVNIASSIASGARQLYDAELTRLRMGESSVFLANTRELQYLQAQNTLIDLRTEEILQAYRLLFDLGILYSVSE